MTPTKTPRQIAEEIAVYSVSQYPRYDTIRDPMKMLLAIQQYEKIITEKIAEAIQAERDAQKQEKSDTSGFEDYWNKTHEFKNKEEIK
jgi:hypothetical protein